MPHDTPAAAAMRSVAAVNRYHSRSMWFMVCYILSAVTFGQLFRLAQHGRDRTISAAMVNYVVAALLSLVWLMFTADPTYEALPLALAFGSVNGVLYYLHLLLILQGYRIVGVGVTAALYMIASVMPVPVAWLIWGEPVSVFQWIAVALLPMAAILMRPRTARGQGAKHLTWRDDLILLLLFCVGGLIVMLHKSVDVMIPTSDRPIYNVALFFAAAVTSVIFFAMQRRKLQRRDVAIGLPIGMVNTLTLIFVLAALARLPTAIIFPVSGTMIILLNVIVSRLAWKERLARRQFFGMAVVVVVVLLANIKQDDSSRHEPSAGKSTPLSLGAIRPIINWYGRYATKFTYHPDPRVAQRRIIG
jgi:drug/metabolite transporter (DMT)-like permease